MSIESMVKALYTPDLSPSEKLLLVGIANHDGDGGAWPSLDTLATYVGVKERQVRNLLRGLEQRGLVTTDINGGGTTRTPNDRRPNRYELHFDGRQPSAPREGQPIAAETSTGTVSTSSLRSDGDVREESGSDALARADDPPASTESPGRVAAKLYWDAFVAQNNGLRPSTPYLQLAAVARKALKSGLKLEEVAAAMLSTRVMTGEAVVKEAIRIRRERDNAPATGTIEPMAVNLCKAWLEWLPFPPERISGALRGELLQTLTTMLRWPSMTPVEVAARFGGYVRAHQSGIVPTVQGLKEVPLESRPPRPTDTEPIVVFRKYATGSRLEG